MFGHICIIWFFNFELFEGGLSNHKNLNILLRILKFIKLVWRKIDLVTDNQSVHKNTSTKEFYMKKYQIYWVKKLFDWLESNWEFVGLTKE